MDAAELEKFVGDLEIAVDRLRSLYEQYFMGIEKMEPLVPRKDVDRRIQVLRKEQIRNTAQRFRFQMVLQRYNTYQTHWQRICREIDNGTYKRHIIRARQRFGEGGRGGSVPPPGPADDASAVAVAAAPRAAPVLARPGAVARELEQELADLDRDFAPAGPGQRGPGSIEEIGDDDLELDTPLAAPVAPGRRGVPAWRKADPAAARAPHDASIPPPRPQPRAPGAAPAMAPLPARPPVPPPRGAPPPRPAPSATAGAGVRAVPPRPAPQLPTSAAPARPAPAAPNAPTAPAAAARPAPELPDTRVRELYAQYVDTKRQQKESTAAITYDAVAKSLRDSSAKLREKHGKAVDFEVSIKDGKTILKPVIK